MSYREQYEELYKTLSKSKEELSHMNMGDLLFYCRKKLGKIDFNQREHNSYLFRQIVEYKESDFLEHIKKHMSDYNAGLEEPNPNIFMSGFPIKEVISEEYCHFFDAAAPIITKDSINMDIAFCGALSPEMIENIESTHFFNVHWLTILSSEEKILARLEISKIKESTGAILRNEWVKANYKTVFPQVKLLDITEMSDELVADTIDRWIVSHSSHNLQQQE